MAVAEAYIGGSRRRKPTRGWRHSHGDADTDILPDLPTLRERSRDLVRNTPIATGAINTKVTNIVGGGLRLQCRVDRDFLGMDEDEADEWERNTQREFSLWASSQECSITRDANLYEMQDLVFRSTLENGDVFVLMPLVERQRIPYRLALNLIEADRVCNESNAADKPNLAGGIERDERGTPTIVHILNGHPGNPYSSQSTWKKVRMFGARTGRRNVLHIYRKLRIGQSRGVPDLAPVIEALKQLSDYTEAEIQAAVVSGLLTVFVKSDGGINPLEVGSAEGISSAESDEVKLGSGAIIDLADNESIETVNPSRPNTAYDPFVMSVLRQIGVALELPFELLIMHFTASYSASRAALELAWKFFRSRREFLIGKFCMPVYEEWMTEAVELGRIAAPGFLDGDPAVRAAYLGCSWTGPAKGHIQPLQEIKAEVEAYALGTKTLDRITAEATGEDWESVHRQRTKELRMIRRDQADVGSPASASSDEEPDDPDEMDEPEQDDEGTDTDEQREEDQE